MNNKETEKKLVTYSAMSIEKLTGMIFSAHEDFCLIAYVLNQKDGDIKA